MKLRLHHKNYIFLLFLLFQFVLLNKSKACDCIIYPVNHYMKTSKYVFLVHVDSVGSTNDRGDVNAKVTIKESYKGSLPKREVIYFTSEDSLSSCSFRFKKNFSYLIFAYSKGNKFFVYKCSRSENLNLKYTKQNIRKIKQYLKKKKKIED